MCGIAGFIGTELREDQALAALPALGASLAHRGPDDSGTIFDADAGVGLVHRRLAIIDLNPTGHQPMLSPDARLVLVFNGELYNFEELRTELSGAGASFAGTSDTEVLLQAIRAWGIEAALRRAIGMFAFALWDRAERTLYLARDRLGEKPLGLVRLRRGFAFASEFSALRAAGFLGTDIDRTALALYLKYAYVPAPHAIHAGTRKLLPGSIVAIAMGAPPAACAHWSVAENHGDLRVLTTRYWNPRALTRSQGAFRTARSDVETEFGELLHDAVRLQLRADVPVGAFLSGGIDSSLVCSIAASVADRPLKTFTMGFDNVLFDESAHAQAVASHLGTDHQCVRVGAKDVMEMVPRLAEISDEPFADPSQLPTYLVSKLARREVKVCLTGDGGDELFGGYNRYIEPPRLFRRIERLPRSVARIVATGLRGLPAGAIDGLVSAASSVVRSKRLRVQSPGRKLHRLADLFVAESPQALYDSLMSHWREPAELLGERVEVPRLTDSSKPWSWDSFAERAMLWDIEHYLPDNNLAKVDRASMAVSLETRLPLLDHRIVELAVSAPLGTKIDGGAGKLILRNALRQHIPEELINRPKMGFSVPVAAWLRGPLREWAEDLLARDTISRIGLFDAEPVLRCWREHVTGRADNYQRLWLILQAHAWYLNSGNVVKQRT